MIDDRNEREQRDKERNMQNAASFASHYYETKILGFGNLSENEALDLGASYVASMVELRLHIADSLSTIQEDLPKDEFQFETALGGATRGDRTLLKVELLKVADEMDKSGKDVFANRIRILVSKISDSGSPFKLPSPAWRDPRFNGKSTTANDH